MIVVIKNNDNDFFKEDNEDTTDFSLIKGDTMQQVEDLEDELKRK
ncbi:D-alanyl-D-alanine carboxypeptidase [Bacillus anthracis]|nr:D-alanyl-D-alanine carboxypeptidase [Bacillus cereus]OUA69565.1 D-alanyl-D-alanine carboxypeptidase [Bacillus thuringiensis serovar thailandensis]PEF62872.1 D-alanyl-D-alanine carboxypeptidase [Bacillus anthracis]PHA12450.1 D-alanyl-D-alanine carboxypeptidase [Bacillus sp. AFS051223]TXR74193.1 D-alanyl-D-alanine carboxypeptidase [Bacillus sp. BF9-10]